MTNTRVGSRQRLPARVRLLLTGDAVTAVGMGLTQPYLLVLLHTTYGLSIAAATATAALPAAVSLVGNPLSGVLTDRYGGRLTMVGGLASVVAGLLTLAAGHTAPVAAIGVGLTGFGWSLVLPALATLIAQDLDDAGRSRVFTLQYALFNVGLGAGAAIGGRVVADDGGRTDLSALWFAAAASCAAAGFIVASLRTGPVAAGLHGTTEPPDRSGYRRALEDRALWRVLAIAVGMSAAGYGVYAVGPSVVALSVDDPAALSWVSTANCATVVLGMPVALRFSALLRPHAALRATAVSWAAAWALCLATVSGVGPGVPVALPVAGALVGVGELLMASALPTLVNALAPDALRGRYNALLTVAMTMGVWTGPLLASLTSAVGHVALLFVVALVLLAVVAAHLRTPVRVP